MVFAFERIGKRNIAYQLFFHQFRQAQRALALGHAAGIHGGGGQIVKRLALACAQVENARLAGVVEKEKIHLHHIFHAHKITGLAAGGIAVVGAEQIHIAVFAILVEMVESHRSHAALVLLVRAVNVEIAETRHLRGEPVGNAAAHHLVKQKFGIAIHIERLFQFALFTENLALAIHGGA